MSEWPLPDDPMDAVRAWYAEAVQREPDVPDAMQIATVGEGGRPSIRTVLAKELRDEGVVFFTNLESRKGSELATNPRLAAVFHWKSLARQVVLEGAVERLGAEESAAYAASRPRGSQIGAWASPQSRAIPDRDWLVARVGEFEARFADRPVPLPPHWGGFLLRVERAELWQGREDRLHDRFVWERTGRGWRRLLLAP
jgi:pyridoxamine 5'-phosphate oxidase